MPEPQKDYAIGNLATIPALEGLALHAIACQTLAIQIQDPGPAVVASASPMAIAAKEVDIAQKAGGDASALKIV